MTSGAAAYDQEIDLHLEPNEASDLAAVPAEAVPANRGWDMAFVTVLDEGIVEKSIAVLGHSAGETLAEGWVAERLELRATAHAEATDDAEACDFQGGHLYVAGSHYGSKTGPVQSKRAWLARLDATDLARALDGERIPLEIARNRFALHRTINDALARSGLELTPLGPTARDDLIAAAVKRGKKRDKRWAGRVLPDDHPINIEGLTFRPGGGLLLGLRYPVTSGGSPILVEIDDVDAFFAGDEEIVPPCSAVWSAPQIGSPDEPLGVRGLHRSPRGAEIDVLVGSLDAVGKDSALLADHPVGGLPHCEHWRVRLPDGALGGAGAAEHVRDFPGLKAVEGVAQTPEGHFLYVVDQDQRVHLRFLAAD